MINNSGLWEVKLRLGLNDNDYSWFDSFKYLIKFDSPYHSNSIAYFDENLQYLGYDESTSVAKNFFVLKRVVTDKKKYIKALKQLNQIFLQNGT